MMLALVVNLTLASTAPAAQAQPCIATRTTPGAAEQAVGKSWFVNNETISSRGKTHKIGSRGC